MKIIKLSNGMECFVDDADFESLGQFNWHALKTKNGHVYAYRATRKPDGRRSNELMHRMLSNPGANWVDHRDGNGLNNQRDNMRICLPRQNCMNRRKTTGTSKYKGVYKNGDRWCAGIRVNFKNKFLGCFDHEETAALFYDEAALEAFGEFAVLNFPTPESVPLFLSLPAHFVPNPPQNQSQTGPG